MWSLIKTTCKQPPSIDLHFHQLSDFYISGLGGVSGTSDWSYRRKKEEKKKEIKVPNWDKWV